MRNVFSINDIPGTNQCMEVKFNDLGDVESVTRKDKSTLEYIEGITYHVNGQPHIVTRSDGNGCWYPMTSLIKNQPFRLS